MNWLYCSTKQTAKNGTNQNPAYINQIINSSCMVNTADALSVGGWDHAVEGLEDFDFWIRFKILN